MMPFSKEQNRRIYVTALVVSFLLIVGSIYLHVRQKTHLGRMSFNLDRDRVQPTSGVESSTWMEKNEYESKFATDENLNIDNEPEDNENFTTDDIPKYNDYIFEPSYEQYNMKEEIDYESILEKVDYFNYGLNYSSYNDVLLETSSDEEYKHFSNNEQYYTDDNSDYNMHANTEITKFKNIDLYNNCIRCMCMTVNECRPTFCYTSDIKCGLYRISKFYWIDSGKPTVNENRENDEEQEYLKCINDVKCSEKTLMGYNKRYKRDCNKDGNIDCQDHIALHLLGPSGCLTQNLTTVYTTRMNKCLAELDST